MVYIEETTTEYFLDHFIIYQKLYKIFLLAYYHYYLELSTHFLQSPLSRLSNICRTRDSSASIERIVSIIARFITTGILRNAFCTLSRRDSRNCISVAWRRVGSVHHVSKPSARGRSGRGQAGACCGVTRGENVHCHVADIAPARRRAYALSRFRPIRYTGH